MPAVHPLPHVTIETDTTPLLTLLDHGEWILEFEDAATAVTFGEAQLRAMVDQYLAQKLGELDD